MQCPRCNSEKLSVVDSRGDKMAIRRRRECQDCEFRFTTFERIELAMPLIIKKDGRREPFDVKKIRAGLLRACEKRPISIEAIDETIANIEKKISELCEKELSGRTIGEMIMAELKGLDKIAYVRFASVYREFSDISQFVETLQTLKDQKQGAGMASVAPARPATVKTPSETSRTRPN